jgi:hypothetical protein
MAQGCAFCGDEADGLAGCGLALYMAPEVKVGQVWLPLCRHDVKFIFCLAQERRRHDGPVLWRQLWEVTCLHDGARWMFY